MSKVYVQIKPVYEFICGKFAQSLRQNAHRSAATAALLTSTLNKFARN